MVLLQVRLGAVFGFCAFDFLHVDPLHFFAEFAVYDGYKADFGDQSIFEKSSYTLLLCPTKRTTTCLLSESIW